MSAILPAKGNGISGQGVATLARRRFQTGSVFLRGKKGNQVWVGRWREDVLQPDCTLQRILRSEVLGTLAEIPTKRLAQRELQTRLENINSPTYTGTRSSTLGEFITKWKESVLPNMKPSTQAAIKSQLKNYIEGPLETVNVRNISAELLQMWIRGLKGSPKTVRNVVGIMKMLMKSAIQWKYLQEDPAEHLVLPKRAKVDVRFFTEEEMCNIIYTAEGPTKLFFWLAAETGLRAGELAGLRWQDVDLANRVVYVQQSVWRGDPGTTKTLNAERAPSISPTLAEQLRLHQKKGATYVFETSNGTPWDPNMVVKRKLYPILDSLGIKRAGMHAFRHGNASVMDRKKVPLKVRQERLGHADPTMTLGRYTHIVSEDDRKFSEEFGNIIQNFDPNFVPNSEARTA